MFMYTENPTKPQQIHLTIDKKVDYDPDPEMSYLEQPGFEQELKNYQNGQFTFAYVQAVATILLPAGRGSFIIQTIESPGLYGIAVEDFDDPYLDEIYNEEKATLYHMLDQLKDLPTYPA